MNRWLSFFRTHNVDLKLLYITMNFAYYSCYTFRAKFFDAVLKVNTGQYSYLAGALALLTFFASFGWSAFADAIKGHKLILLWSSLLAAMSFQLFLIRIEGSEVGRSIYIYGVSALYVGFCAAMAPLLDKLVLEVLQSRPSKPGSNTKELYGRQRLWGTAAYGVITFATGPLIDCLGYNVIFVQIAITTVVFLVYGYMILPSDSAMAAERQKRKELLELEESKLGSNGLPKDHISPCPTPDPTVALIDEKKKKERRPIFRLLTNAEYIFFLLVIFMNGFARAVLTFNLSKYQETHMGLNKFQVGITCLFGIILEIALFFVSKWCLRRLGVYWMLLGAQFSMVARVWAYYVIPAEPSMFYAVCAVELLKGINFGLMHSAGIQLAHRVAPKGLEATAQGLYTGVFTGLSAFAAGIFGGLINDDENKLPLFMYTAIISTVALLIFLVKYALIDGVINFGFVKMDFYRSKKHKKDSLETAQEK